MFAVYYNELEFKHVDNARKKKYKVQLRCKIYCNKCLNDAYVSKLKHSHAKSVHPQKCNYE